MLGQQLESDWAFRSPWPLVPVSGVSKGLNFSSCRTNSSWKHLDRSCGLCGQSTSYWGDWREWIWCQHLQQVGPCCQLLVWVGVSATSHWGRNSACVCWEPDVRGHQREWSKWGTQHQQLEQDHGSQPMCLVLAAGTEQGRAFASSPKLALIVVCVCNFSSNFKGRLAS